jgi:putative transcription antitermination factor YqgF
MKLLGIDFGLKRVGVAVSSDDGSLAFPRAVLPNDGKLVEALATLAREEGAEAVVMGESRDLDGTENRLMGDIRRFAGALGRATGLPVHFEPEYMTSAEAERVQGKSTGHDASAAALILKSFIDKGGVKAGGHATISPMEPAEEKQKIAIDDFAKVEIRVGRILSAEKVEGADKLLRLSVDLGEAAPRTILSGIALHFPDPASLAGKHACFVANLAPRTIRGHESDGMILAASSEGTDGAGFALLEVPDSIAPGTRVR